MGGIVQSMYGPQQQPYYQQPRYAAPVSPTMTAAPAAPAAPKPAAPVTEAVATPAAAVNTYNAQIPGSFMAMFWLLAIGVFLLVIAVITKLYCQHKRGEESRERRAKYITQYNSNATDRN